MADSRSRTDSEEAETTGRSDGDILWDFVVSAGFDEGDHFLLALSNPMLTPLSSPCVVQRAVHQV